MEGKDEVVQYALRESEEYRRLEKEHRDLDQTIVDKFGAKKYLTPEEELEKKSLQKQKLIKKDRMYQILSDLKAAAR